MKAILVLLVATAAHAAPCPTPTIRVHKNLAEAKDALKSVPPQAAPELGDQGAAFFVSVPLGSPEGSDAVDYKVDAIVIRKQGVVVVDDLARWRSVLPPPGHASPTSPARSIRVDGSIAHLDVAGYREVLVDVAAAKLVGCAK